MKNNILTWDFTKRFLRNGLVYSNSNFFGYISNRPKKLCIGDKLFRYGDFFSEKIIVGPQEAQYP